MKLIIKIQDNKPVDHPIILENFIQAFPETDPDNLPDNFAWFERVPRPKAGPYTKNIYCNYEYVGNMVKDVWYIEEMSLEEKAIKQTQTKQEWAQTGYSSWVFNEETCSFDPPILYPTDGKVYVWNEESINWSERIN